MEEEEEEEEEEIVAKCIMSFIPKPDVVVRR